MQMYAGDAADAKEYAETPERHEPGETHLNPGGMPRSSSANDLREAAAQSAEWWRKLCANCHRYRSSVNTTDRRLPVLAISSTVETPISSRVGSANRGLSFHAADSSGANRMAKLNTGAANFERSRSTINSLSLINSEGRAQHSV